MRIVDRATFLAMPAGTLYAKYEPCVFGELQVKEGTCYAADRVTRIDFYTQQLIPWFNGTQSSSDYFDTLEAAEKGTPTPAFDMPARDGLFDDDQLFAIFERADVEALIAKLTRSLVEGYGS